MHAWDFNQVSGVSVDPLQYTCTYCSILTLVSILRSVLAVANSVIRSKWLYLTAKCTAASPCYVYYSQHIIILMINTSIHAYVCTWFNIDASALNLSNTWTTFACPFCAARWSGVQPFLLMLSAKQEDLSSILVTSACPFHAASCKALLPYYKA